MSTTTFVDIMNITQERLKELLTYWPEEGVFFWRERRGHVEAGAKAGSISKGYIRISIEGKMHSAHRLAFLWMTGEIPDCDIDHINGQRDDNRWSNLRAVTRSANTHNRVITPPVYQSSKNRWTANYQLNGVKVSIGYHDTREAAEDAYRAATGDMKRLDSPNHSPPPVAPVEAQKPPKGITAFRGRWRVRIRHDGKTHDLGMFTELDDAIAAYTEAKEASRARIARDKLDSFVAICKSDTFV